MSPMVRRPPGMELALLGFLLQDSQHGYQLHQMISDPSGLGLIWHLKQSQLYALLAKLETEGWVTSTLQSQEPHPPRRVFELTQAGKKTFQEWRISPVTAPRLIRQDFFAKLFFALREDRTVVMQLIDSQRDVCKGWLIEFKEKLESSENLSYRWSMYQYRLGQVQALLSWLDAYEIN